MLHMYKTPPLGGQGRTPQRIPIYNTPFGPKLGGQSQSDGG